jgi:hypothetical protein
VLARFRDPNSVAARGRGTETSFSMTAECRSSSATKAALFLGRIRFVSSKSASCLSVAFDLPSSWVSGMAAAPRRDAPGSGTPPGPPKSVRTPYPANSIVSFSAGLLHTRPATSSHGIPQGRLACEFASAVTRQSVRQSTGHGTLSGLRSTAVAGRANDKARISHPKTQEEPICRGGHIRTSKVPLLRKMGYRTQIREGRDLRGDLNICNRLSRRGQDACKIWGSHDWWDDGHCGERQCDLDRRWKGVFGALLPAIGDSRSLPTHSRRVHCPRSLPDLEGTARGLVCYALAGASAIVGLTLWYTRPVAADLKQVGTHSKRMINRPGPSR